MRRNVLATELLLPLLLGVVILIPAYVAVRLLGWSDDAFTGIGFLVAILLALTAEPVCSWLAPRLGLAPPRRIGKRGDA